MNIHPKERENKWIFKTINDLESHGIKSCTNLMLKEVSSFSIGGPCDLAVFPNNSTELIRSVEIALENNIDFETIGKASNILFSDAGYRGMLIFTSHMRQITHNGSGKIFAEAGANLTSISVRAAGWGLSGLEFACGIPGSCAGAVYMNAGAYGGEISDVLEYSEYYDVNQKRINIICGTDHDFSYRHSIYQNRKDLIITGAGFKLTSASMEIIRSAMEEYTQRRKSSQPHEYPNAGSIFKRPKDGFAAKMIDECGLKGLSVGGAQVSEKHAGFIVNRGNATASDVLTLIDVIKEKVFAEYGVELECEIRIM